MNGGVRFLLLSLLLVAASVCLAFGLTMPILRLTSFYIWTDVHSLISIVGELYLRDEIFLAVIIVLFSIVFPVLKLLYLCVLHFGQYIYHGRRVRWLKRAAMLGKCSKLAVLLLALVIFYVKTSALTDAVSMSGIYMSAASVVLTMVAHALIEHEVECADEGYAPSLRHDALDNSDNESQT
jgi:paraquat-inducible protein A